MGNIKNKGFPVLSSGRPESCPKYINWDVLDEDHAQYVHSQTLKKLASRGGLCIEEIVMNIEKRPFNDIRNIDPDYALSVVKKLEYKHEDLK